MNPSKWAVLYVAREQRRLGWENPTPKQARKLRKKATKQEMMGRAADSIVAKRLGR